MSNDMWVVTSYFNFNKDPRRELNLTRFLTGIPHTLPVCLVELINDDSEHQERNVALHIVQKISAKEQLWCKEALLNIGIESLPASCTKVCWMDADVFISEGWHKELSAVLDEHPVAQPFSNYVDMNDGETPITTEIKDINKLPKSFAVEAHRRAISGYKSTPVSFYHFHPGYAWAARRDFLEEIGGLFAYCILGHGDLVMAAAMSGHLPTCRALWFNKYFNMYTEAWSTSLKQKASIWQQKTLKAIKKQTIGVVQNTVLYHYYHGSIASRKYKERSLLLSHYNPDRDVCLDDTGMLVWKDNVDPQLQSNVAEYFAQRALAE